MKLLGILLRTPSHAELIAAAVMGTGLWVAAVGCLRLVAVDIDRADAGALLLVALWGCISVRLGIRIGEGHRHLLASLLVSAALLGLYQSAWAVVG